MQTVSRDPAHIFIINFVIAILKARGGKNQYINGRIWRFVLKINPDYRKNNQKLGYWQLNKEKVKKKNIF